MHFVCFESVIWISWASFVFWFVIIIFPLTKVSSSSFILYVNTGFSSVSSTSMFVIPGLIDFSTSTSLLYVTSTSPNLFTDAFVTFKSVFPASSGALYWTVYVPSAFLVAGSFSELTYISVIISSVLASKV